MSREFDAWGECDCCNRGKRWLHQTWVSGMETWACAECRGEENDNET